MGWAKFSDDTHANEHILPLSHAAFRLWASAIMDNRGYKDGRSPFISKARAEALCRQQRIPRRSIKDIESAGRWEPTEGGWNIHDYSEYLPSRREDAEDVERDQKKAEAGRKGAAARWHGDGTAHSTPMAELKQGDGKVDGSRARARVEPVPVPVPVPVRDLTDTRGDVEHGDSNGATPAQPSPQVQVLRVLDWLLAKRGWSSWSSQESQQHEAQLAIHIVELGLPRDELYAKLETWWAESDRDDRPSSLGFFWTRLQDEHHAHLKQEGRSHVRMDGLTKVEPSAKRGPK